MNNINCQIRNHYDEKITKVCLNKDCQDKRLCCFLCIKLIHKSHIEKTIEVEEIYDFIQKQSTEQVQFPQSYCYGQLQIIKGLEQMMDLTESLQKIIKEKLELAKQQNLKEFLTLQNNRQQGIQSWNKLIEGILQYVQNDNFLIAPKQQNEGQLSEKEGEYIQIIRNSEQSIMEIIQSFNLLGQQVKKLSFSKIPIEQAGHQGEVYQVAISQDGSLIASGSSDRTIKLWDNKTKTLFQTIENDAIVQRVAISSKNKFLAFSYYNYSIKLVDLKLNKVLWTQNTNMRNIKCIIFSQDTQYLLSGGNDKKLIIWSVFNKTMIHCFKTDSNVESIVLSRDNKLVSCICSRTGTIYIWDFQTKTQLVEENKAHSSGYGLCTSADQSIYISSGYDGLIKIWKLNESENIQMSLTLTRSIKAAYTINLNCLRLHKFKFQIESSTYKLILLQFHKQSFIDFGQQLYHFNLPY